MAIIDVVTYCGEDWAFDLRYNILKDYVDEFIVVEFDKTFSGEYKRITFPTGYYPKVTYAFHGERHYETYRELAESSPNTIGAEHWKREFMQKESIKDALTHLNDDDIVFIGDVDEVWNPEILKTDLSVFEPSDWTYANGTAKIRLDVYTYYLNNRSSEEFYGTLVGKYKYIKNECLNHLRSNKDASTGGSGWHFTSMGGPEALKKKLTDSYTQESYATPQVLENVAYNIEHGKDFLGRNFTYTLDESQWPQYLKDNRETYKHLML